MPVPSLFGIRELPNSPRHDFFIPQNRTLISCRLVLAARLDGSATRITGKLVQRAWGTSTIRVNGRLHVHSTRNLSHVLNNSCKATKFDLYAACKIYLQSREVALLLKSKGRIIGGDPPRNADGDVLGGAGVCGAGVEGGVVWPSWALQLLSTRARLILSQVTHK